VTDGGQKDASREARLERVRRTLRFFGATQPGKRLHEERLTFFRQPAVFESPRVLEDGHKGDSEVLTDDRGTRQAEQLQFLRARFVPESPRWTRHGRGG
jgi:hypothetical protein